MQQILSSRKPIRFSQRRQIVFRPKRVGLKQTVVLWDRRIATGAIHDHTDGLPFRHVVHRIAIELGEQGGRGQIDIHIPGNLVVVVAPDDDVGEIVAKEVTVDAVAGEEDVNAAAGTDAV